MFLKKVIFIILVFFTSCSTVAVATDDECRHDDKNFRCVEFVRNYDGDTITVHIPNMHPLLGRDASVRLRGVDAPEIRTKNNCEKKMAKKARNFVYKKLKKAKRIDLTNVGKDKYFRILADVIVDGVSLSELLLKKGYTYEYDGETRKEIDWCARLKGTRL